MATRVQGAARRLVLGAALLLGTAGLAQASAPEPAPPGSAEALPACQVADRVVAADPLTDARTLLLDLTWRLPPGWMPPDLVDVSAAGFEGAFELRSIVIDDLSALREAAEAAGVHLAIQSAYRSETYQERVHRGWIDALGPERAAAVSARPGHSEHQLGTALDLRSAAGPPAWDLDDWSDTPEGAWVNQNAHRYGFVLSYPRDARELACYDHEPWHLRWVGIDVAAAVRAEGVPLRVWLIRTHPPVERVAP